MTSSAARTCEVAGPVDPQSWLPCPLVDAAQLSTSVAPGKALSRSRLRTLRAKKLISDGVKVTHRTGGGVAGSSSYYSVLALWAERARSRGFDQDAAMLALAAATLEAEFEGQLKEFLAGHRFQDLPDTGFFWVLADKTAAVLMQTKTWQDTVVAVASVTGLDEHFAHLEGQSLQGTTQSVDLPRHLADANGLDEGVHVFVLSRVMGLGAFVEVDRAVPPREMWRQGIGTRCFLDTHAHHKNSGSREDPESGQEQSPLRDYNAGPGAPLTRDLAAFAWNAVREAGMEPTPLRPAG